MDLQGREPIDVGTVAKIIIRTRLSKTYETRARIQELLDELQAAHPDEVIYVKVLLDPRDARLLPVTRSEREASDGR